MVPTHKTYIASSLLVVLGAFQTWKPLENCVQFHQKQGLIDIRASELCE